MGVQGWRGRGVRMAVTYAMEGEYILWDVALSTGEGRCAVTWVGRYLVLVGSGRTEPYRLAICELLMLSAAEGSPAA